MESPAFRACRGETERDVIHARPRRAERRARCDDRAAANPVSGRGRATLSPGWIAAVTLTEAIALATVDSAAAPLNRSRRPSVSPSAVPAPRRIPACYWAVSRPPDWMEALVATCVGTV